jgi:hypothetical protein
MTANRPVPVRCAISARLDRRGRTTVHARMVAGLAGVCGHLDDGAGSAEGGGRDG